MDDLIIGKYKPNGAHNMVLDANHQQVAYKVRPMLLYIMVFFIAIDKRLFSGVSGVVSVTLLEAFLYVTIVIVFADVVVFSTQLQSRFRRFYKANPYLIIYFLLIIVVAILNAFIGDHLITISLAKDIFPSFLVTLMLFLYLREQQQLIGIIYAMLLGVGFNVLLGVSQGLVGFPRPVPMADSVQFKMDIAGHYVGGLIATGWFTHPNAFSLYLIIAILFLICLVTKKIKVATLAYWCSFFLLPLAVFCLYKTQGKGALIWLLFGGGNWWVISKLNRWRWGWPWPARR